MGGTSQQSLLFRHALIQDAAYQSLLTRKRVQYHHAIADAMVRSHPDIVATQPELIARHYTEGRREDLALPYWKKAGERALERSANYEAIDHFSNALALAERLPDGQDRNVETLAARLRLAEALTEVGRFRAAPRRTIDRCRAVARGGRHGKFCAVALGYDTAQFLGNEALDQSLALLTEADARISLGRRQATLHNSVSARTRALLLGDAEKSENFEKAAN